MLRPPLILIVEDDPLQREVLAELLRSKNIDVIECATAEAAELVIGRSGAELSALISDVMLPGQSGVELARFAKSQFPRLKVVLVSGALDAAPVPHAQFLRKPYSAAELLRELMI
jgi:CheY-like chemotaxis protein